MSDYTFFLDYNVTGPERKRLVKAISTFLQSDSKYLGAPSFAYQVDYMTIDKNGVVSFDSRADSKEIETLLEELEQEGFHAEPAADVAAGAEEQPTVEEVSEEAEPAAQGETVGLTVAIPLDKVNLGNLTCLLDAKGALIQSALGIPATPIEVSEDKVSFPWFTELPEPDAAQAYTHFISALCKMSHTQKRITAKEKPVDNEKYAFRCFLLRLGFIGSECKSERKILLRNLTGSSAFKSGARRVQDCLSCSNSFSEAGEGGNDVLHCMERNGEVVDENGSCESWN